MTETTDDRSLELVYTSATSALRVGFLISATLMMIGLLWLVIAGDDLSPEVTPIQDIPPSLRRGAPMSVVDLALLALMATPIATVLRVAIAFFTIGDRTYCVLSFLVLAILATSVTIALLR